MSGIQGIVSGAVTFISGLWRGLISLLTAPIQAIVDILDATFKEKASGIKRAWGEIKAFLKNPIKGVVSIVETVTSKVKSVISKGKSGGTKSKSGGSKATKKTTKHATGGIFTTPHYALFAEEPGGEAVIPLNGKRRDRAISLWQETGEKLGLGTEKKNVGNQSSYFTTGNRSRFNPKESPDYDTGDDGSYKPSYGFETYSPQVITTGGSNVNVTVEVNNNFDGDIDEDYIVDETTRKVGIKLREALRNKK
jgi:hypothetical protein